jgi:MinD superfamily P-loop ATPase
MMKIDADKCVGCGVCEMDCMGEAITVIDGIAVIDYADCKDCGFCQSLCPQEAIKDDGVNPFTEE